MSDDDAYQMQPSSPINSTNNEGGDNHDNASASSNFKVNDVPRKALDLDVRDAKSTSSKDFEGRPSKDSHHSVIIPPPCHHGYSKVVPSLQNLNV